MFQKDNLLKFVFLLLSCDNLVETNSLTWAIELSVFSTLYRNSHTIFSFQSVHSVNHFVDELDFFLHTLGHCYFLYGDGLWYVALFFGATSSWILNRMNWLNFNSPIEKRWNFQKNLSFFSTDFEFNLEEVEVVLGPRTLFRVVLTFTKVHRVYAS